MKKKRNWIVVALCIAIVGMGIGFAALAQNLQINATANITGEWDVNIRLISPWSPQNWVGATSSTTHTEVIGISATIEVDLVHPGAFAEFTVLVVNDGNIPAKLNSITGLDAINSVEPSEIQVSVMGFTGSFSTTTDLTTVPYVPHETILNPLGANTFIVRVEWIIEPGVESVIPDTKTQTATINFNYVQNT